MSLNNLKMYKNAPLPFQGQKRRFAGAFALALQKCNKNQEIKVVVDLFGGSGLLSHNAKRLFPNVKVVYNDFDDYTRRLRYIDKTNALLTDIRAMVAYQPSGKKIEPAVRDKIIERVEKEDKAGFVDYITLSASLLFSAKYVIDIEGLKRETLYNNVKMCDYDCNADEYLKGLDIVSIDYKQLYEQYKDEPGVIFVVDPPYLSTDTGTYHSDKYWKLRDYLDVLNVLTGTNYIFFTSDKSSLVELCEWFDDNRGFRNPFANSVLSTQNVTLNKSAKYTDMMLYRFIDE